MRPASPTTLRITSELNYRNTCILFDLRPADIVRLDLDAYHTSRVMKFIVIAYARNVDLRSASSLCLRRKIIFVFHKLQENMRVTCIPP